MLKNTVINTCDYSFFTPKNIPSEVGLYTIDIPQLGVGRAGKVGLLRLSLENRKGRTILKDNYHTVPLQVQKALYLDEAVPQMPYLFIMSPSGGILQGDRMRIDIHGQENSAFHITTQAATKIYRMENNFATQILNITLEKGAYAEFLPDMIIPYKNSRFYQEVNLKIHEDATCLYSEIVTPGRVASGESFLYDIFYSRFQATSLSGQFRCLDTMVFTPKTFNAKRIGVLGNWEVVGNFYLLTRKRESKVLQACIENAMYEDDTVCCAASPLPRSDGIFVRILGSKASDVALVCKQIWNAARMQLLGVAAPDLRKQ